MSQIPHDHYCARVSTDPTISSPASTDQDCTKGYFNDNATHLLLGLSPNDAILHSGTYGAKELSVEPIKFSHLHAPMYDQQLLLSPHSTTLQY